MNPNDFYTPNPPEARPFPTMKFIYDGYEFTATLYPNDKEVEVLWVSLKNGRKIGRAQARKIFGPPTIATWESRAEDELNWDSL